MSATSNAIVLHILSYFAPLYRCAYFQQWTSPDSSMEESTSGQGLTLHVNRLLLFESFLGRKCVPRKLAAVNIKVHYENTPIQIYRKFHLLKPKISPPKTENFQIKN